MQTGTSGPWGNGMTQSFTRSKVTVTERRNSSQKSLSVRYFKNYPTTSNQSWQAHIIASVRCVTSTRMQKVKGQGHSRLKLAGGGIILDAFDQITSLVLVLSIYFL